MSQANINSAAPDSTTAQLAAQVPLEGSATNGANDFKKATLSSTGPESTTAALAGNVPIESHTNNISSVTPESTTAALAGDVPKESPVTNSISSVTPESTTAALAGNVPKESPVTNNISSASPHSTTAALAAGVPLENSVPGGFPETPATEVADPTPQVPREEPQQFSVNPLPASDTAENPISLQPGEPVPRDIGTQSLTSNVKLDKESYEGGATNFPVGNLVLPDVVTPAEQRAREGRGVLDLPGITKNMIPESSLPIVGASEVKKDSEAPETVKTEGNAIVGQASAAANSLGSTLGNAATATVAGVTGAAVGIGATTGLTSSKSQPAPEVPEVVKDSIAAADAPTEASAVSASVEAKKEIESELKREVPEAAATATKGVESVSPIAQENASVVLNQTAPVVTDGITSSTIKVVEEAPTVDPALSKTADFVPEPVKDSLIAAGAPAEAAGVAAAVQKKEVVEQQLKKIVHPTTPAAASPTPVESATPAAPSTPAAEAAPIAPVHSNGHENGTSNGNGLAKKDSPPAPSVNGTATSKKAKRRSFFGRLQEKLHLKKKQDPETV